MKKLLLLAILFISVVVAGCGDKFAKDKEEILKAEKAALGLFAPYLERACLRFATPAVSNVPRMM